MRRSIEAAIDAAVPEYIQLRDQVVSSREEVVPDLKRLARSRRPGIALAARSWLGWIHHGDDFRRVMHAFILEEDKALKLQDPRPPSAVSVAKNVVRSTGRHVIPLLAEILWKTGADFPEWRNQACLVALQDLGGASARRALVAVFRLVEDPAKRRLVLDTLERMQNAEPRAGRSILARELDFDLVGRFDSSQEAPETEEALRAIEDLLSGGATLPSRDRLEQREPE